MKIINFIYISLLLDSIYSFRVKSKLHNKIRTKQDAAPAADAAAANSTASASVKSTPAKPDPIQAEGCII
jgi:hypothetical protein